MKLTEHLDFEMEGHTALPFDRVLQLAQETAASTQGVEAGSRKQVFRIKHATGVLALDVRQIKPQGDAPDEHIWINASWSKETLERVGKSYEGVLGMALAYVRGVPGFARYRTYLQALTQAIQQADPTAEIAAA